MTPASAFNPYITAVPEALACATFIIGSFIVSGTAHVLWLRSAASLRLALPIDCGLSLFGAGIHWMFSVALFALGVKERMA